MPHRRLSTAELAVLFDQVDAGVADFYGPLSHDVMQAVTEAEEHLARVTRELEENPRWAELEARWPELIRTPTDTDERREMVRAAYAEQRALLKPKEEAEAALQAAKKAYNEFISEEDQAIRISTYLAGQRLGLRLGVKMALKALYGEPLPVPAGAPSSPGRMAVQMAVAMIEDDQADQLIEALLAPDHHAA